MDNEKSLEILRVITEKEIAYQRAVADKQNMAGIEISAQRINETYSGVPI